MVIAGVPVKPEITGTLDERIRDAVMVLREAGVDTFASCQGGPGHMFRLPTIRFQGDEWAARLAIRVLAKNGYAADEVRHYLADEYLSKLSDEFWEITLAPEITQARLSASVAACSEKDGWRAGNGTFYRLADWAETLSDKQ